MKTIRTFIALALIAVTSTNAANANVTALSSGATPNVVHRANETTIVTSLEAEPKLNIEAEGVAPVVQAPSLAAPAATTPAVQTIEPQTANNQQLEAKSSVQSVKQAVQAANPVNKHVYRWSTIGLAVAGLILGIIGVITISNPLVIIGLVVLAGALALFFINPRNRPKK